MRIMLRSPSLCTSNQIFLKKFGTKGCKNLFYPVHFPSMKKISLVLVPVLLILLLTTEKAFALIETKEEKLLQDERTKKRLEIARDQEKIECPLRENVEWEIELPQEEDCKNMTFLKYFAAKNFHNEMRELQKVFDVIHHDNVSNPEFIVSQGVKHLRIHHQCLQDICRNVLWKCAGTPHLRKTQVSDEWGWCKEKANKIMDLQKAKFEFIATGNQARKERILLEEKFRAIRERFRNQIHERMTNFLVQLKRFEGHVDKLIRWPKRN